MLPTATGLPLLTPTLSAVSVGQEEQDPKISNGMCYTDTIFWIAGQYQQYVLQPEVSTTPRLAVSLWYGHTHTDFITDPAKRAESVKIPHTGYNKSIFCSNSSNSNKQTKKYFTPSPPPHAITAYKTRYIWVSFLRTGIGPELCHFFLS